MRSKNKAFEAIFFLKRLQHNRVFTLHTHKESPPKALRDTRSVPPVFTPLCVNIY